MSSIETFTKTLLPKSLSVRPENKSLTFWVKIDKNSHVVWILLLNINLDFLKNFCESKKYTWSLEMKAIRPLPIKIQLSKSDIQEMEAHQTFRSFPASQKDLRLAIRTWY